MSDPNTQEPTPAQRHLAKTIKGLVYVRNEMANRRVYWGQGILGSFVKLLDAVIKDLEELREMI